MKRILIIAVLFMVIGCGDDGSGEDVNGPGSLPGIDDTAENPIPAPSRFDKLTGKWTFSYSIGGEPYSTTYQFDVISGEYLTGSNSIGGLVVVQWDDLLDKFVMYDYADPVDLYFTFGVAGGSAAGCVYPVYGSDSDNLSECYHFKGVKVAENARFKTQGAIKGICKIIS